MKKGVKKVGTRKASSKRAVSKVKSSKKVLKKSVSKKVVKKGVSKKVEVRDVGFGGVFRDSWNMLRDRFAIIASLALIFSFLPNVIFELWDRGRPSKLVDGVVPSISDALLELQTVSPWLLVIWFLSTFFSVSLIYFLNYEAKKKDVSFGRILKGGWDSYYKALLLGLLLLLLLIPLYILLIVPGVIFQIYWVFAFYVLVAERKSVVGSIKGSYEIVKGRWWKVFGYMILFYIIIGIFGGVLNGIFAMIGSVGVILQVLVGTLLSVFSLIFVNSFYLRLKR